MREYWLGDSNGPMGDVGAFMSSELRVDRADLAAHIRQLDGARNLIAIAGAPAAGKSTLATEIAAALNGVAAGSAAVVTMDGFHRSNAELDAMGLRHRKGAPETFDADGFVRLVRGLRAGTDQSAPTFDRAADHVINDGETIPSSVRYVLIEGTYVLLNRPVWSDLFPMFDLSIRISVPEDTLRARLHERWSGRGDAVEQIEGNDLPNGRILATEGRAADLVIYE